MKLSDIRRRLNEIENINQVELCARKFRSLSSGLHTYAVKIPKGSVFFRAVPWNELKNDVSWLRYPPKKHTNRGRCNQENQPVFYCSRNYETIFAEQKDDLKLGDLFGVGRWVVNSDFYVVPIGLTEIEGKKIRALPENASFSSEHRIIHNKIRKFFINKGDQYYTQSIAISQTLLGFKLPPEYEVVDTAICFRSVEHPNIEKVPLNFVFTTSFFERYFELEKCQYQQVESINDQGVGLTALKKSVEIKGSEIIWKDAVSGWTIDASQPFGSIVIPEEGEPYEMLDEFGDKIIPELDKHNAKY